jgi:4-amino-4-deoxy-L-arabinose transferase-like glycosyltransferase
VFGLLVAVALPVFLLSLGANTIWDANEAFYVETPRQMVLTGDYVTPVFNGTERLNKPVLSYWLVAGLYQLFGVSVGVERLAIALGAIGMVVAAFLVGRALRSTTVGLVAALIVATAPRVVMWGRRIAIDVHVTMFMSLTLACFVLAERYPAHRRRLLVAMYVAIGLGVLTKGPVALVLPAAALAVWLTVERRWADLRHLMILPGAAVVFAIVAPWYVALVVEHGWDPVTMFFVGENLDRFTTAMQPDHRPFWFYAPVVLSDLFPWAPLLVVALASIRGLAAQGAGSGGAIRRLLWIWIAVIVGGFSLSATKQDLYVFPVVVPTAVLIAEALVTSRFGRDRVAIRVTVAVVALVSAVAGALVLRWFAGDGYYALAGARLIGLVLVAGGIVTAALALFRRGREAVLLLSAVFIVFNYLFVTQALPAVERLKPVQPLAEVFRGQASAGARLGAYHLMLPSLVYYADQTVESLESPDAARAFFAGGPAWAIVDDGRFDELRQEAPSLCVVARRPRMDPRLSDVIAGRPPGDVFLVTNQCPASTN